MDLADVGCRMLLLHEPLRRFSTDKVKKMLLKQGPLRRCLTLILVAILHQYRKATMWSSSLLMLVGRRETNGVMFCLDAGEKDRLSMRWEMTLPRNFNDPCKFDEGGTDEVKDDLQP
jgi:hypothetical protein